MVEKRQELAWEAHLQGTLRSLERREPEKMGEDIALRWGQPPGGNRNMEGHTQKPPGLELDQLIWYLLGGFSNWKNEKMRNLEGKETVWSRREHYRVFHLKLLVIVHKTE